VNGFFGTYYFASNVQRYFVDGTPTCCNIEATLDIEWATATANSFGTSANTAQVNVYEGVNSNHSTIIDTLNRALTDGHARVVNMSWGAAENYEVTSAQMDSYHAVFNQMVGQGWTLVAASGDGGATTDCANHLSVSYPGSDPDVTSAGGTSLSATSSYYYIETGWSGGWGGCAQNDGGGGGGCSAYYGMPDYQGVYPACGTSSRSVPDLALNADGDYNPQVLYFQGSWQLVGGTSVGSPELAGFFAQENAYLLSIQGLVGNTCGPSFSAACAPMGNANYYIYDEGFHHHAPHFPFYDIVSGCNGNDITQQFGLTPFCAAPSYDLVTGWGSANMLQFAWAINNSLAGDASAPSATFSGPQINHWFNTDQTLSWTIADTTANGHRPDGVSGFAYAWDQDPGDTYSEATPGGNWSTFYTGPPYPNGTSGAVALSTANVYGAGCHTLYVRTWDNAGQSGPSTYGPVCYDIYPPYTTPIFYGNELNGTFIGPVLTALQAQDSGSGVASTTYRVDGGRWQSYVLPFSIAVPGTHVLNFYSTDIAGNVETVEQASFTISSNFDSTLTVSKPGSGSGTVTTGDGDIYCGDICSHVYYDGTPITLTATPSTGSVLTGWSGCDSVTGATCIVTVNSDQTVIALFSTASALRFIPVTPCRVADTRLADGPFGGPAINAGDYRDYIVSDGPCGKFPNAAAYSLNVAVVPHASLSYLTTWPSGLDRPLVATMNSLDGRIKSNAAIVPVGANNAISVYVTDTTDVILDVNGYFVPETTDQNALQFYPVTPCRVVDTRKATGPFGGPSLVGKQVRDFPMLQNTTCSLPPTAQAYSLNFAVVPPGPVSYLTAWPADQQQPLVATLNDLTGTITANAAIVPAATTSTQTVDVGDIDVYVTDNTDLVIDINGYFAPAGIGGQSLYTLSPCRVIDTRRTTGLFTNVLTPPIGVVDSPCGVPAMAQGVIINATVVPSGQLGYLTLWADGKTQPVVSTLNALDGAITNNMAIVPMTDGSVEAFASGYTQLIMDIFGYFAPE
jgi:hypothetical protein